MFTAVGPPSSPKFVPDMPPLLCLENPDLCHPPTADPRSINFPARSERRVRHRRNIVFFCLLFMKSRNCLSRRKKVSPNRRGKREKRQSGRITRSSTQREREREKRVFLPPQETVITMRRELLSPFEPTVPSPNFSNKGKHFDVFSLWRILRSLISPSLLLKCMIYTG